MPDIHHVQIFFGTLILSLIVLVRSSSMTKNLLIQKCCNLFKLGGFQLRTCLMTLIDGEICPWVRCYVTVVFLFLFDPSFLINMSDWISKVSGKMFYLLPSRLFWKISFLVIYLTIKFLGFSIEEIILLVVVTSVCISS